MVTTDTVIRAFDTNITKDRLNDVTAPRMIGSGAETLEYDQNTDTILYCDHMLGNLVGLEPDGSSRTLIRWMGTRVRGLAVDWSSDLIYYTDEETQSINVVSRDGKKRAIILDLNGSSSPTEIVVDPESK